MKKNRSIPDASVIPVLIYPDVREAVTWLTGAFGFAERLRIGENHRSQLRFGDGGALIIGDVHGTAGPAPRRGYSLGNRLSAGRPRALRASQVVRRPDPHGADGLRIR